MKSWSFLFEGIRDAIMKFSWWKKEQRPLIFIIGFNKTATRSIHQLFAGNGYASVHWDDGKLALRMLRNMLSGKKILTGYDRRYQVYSDMIFANHSINIEANSFFKILDRDYPGSFFIYNKRNLEDWLRSRASQSQKLGENSFIKRQMSLNNTSEPDVVFEVWKTQRLRLESDVRSYFKGATNFVEIDINNDDVPGMISDLLQVELDGSHWGHIGKKKYPASPQV